MVVVAPAVGGVQAADGTQIPAQFMIDGGPSVLFDAWPLVVSEAGAERLATRVTALDFVSAAFNHCKVIAHTAEAAPLLVRAGLDPAADEGMIRLDGAAGAAAFVAACRRIRIWGREPAIWG